MTGNVSIGAMAPMPSRAGDGQARAKAGGEQASARNGFDDALQTRNPRAKAETEETKHRDADSRPADDTEDEPFWKVALAAAAGEAPADVVKEEDGIEPDADDPDAVDDEDGQTEAPLPDTDAPAPQAQVDPETIVAAAPAVAANAADVSQRRTGEGKPVGAGDMVPAASTARPDAPPVATQPSPNAAPARAERMPLPSPPPPPTGDATAGSEGQRRGDITISSPDRPSPLARLSFTPFQVATLDARSLPAPVLQPAVLATFGMSGLASQPSVQAVPLALGMTGESLVSAIEGNANWRSAAAEAAQQPAARAPGAAGMTTSMRIQLHPAELGMVTARLVSAGSQMSIEIQVETNDARQRLSAETDAIIKALRSVGLEVDRLTIQQSAQSSQQAGAGQQGLAQGGGQDREGMFAQQQSQGGEGGRRDGGAGGNGAEGNDDAQSRSVQDRAGGGVYI